MFRLFWRLLAFILLEFLVVLGGEDLLDHLVFIVLLVVVYYCIYILYDGQHALNVIILNNNYLLGRLGAILALTADFNWFLHFHNLA